MRTELLDGYVRCEMDQSVKCKVASIIVPGPCISVLCNIMHTSRTLLCIEDNIFIVPVPPALDTLLQAPVKMKLY